MSMSDDDISTDPSDYSDIESSSQSPSPNSSRLSVSSRSTVTVPHTQFQTNYNQQTLTQPLVVKNNFFTQTPIKNESIQNITQQTIPNIKNETPPVSQSTSLPFKFAPIHTNNDNPFNPQQPPPINILQLLQTVKVENTPNIKMENDKNTAITIKKEQINDMNIDNQPSQSQSQSRRPLRKSSKKKPNFTYYTQPRFDRAELEKLTLDELLAKAMSFMPDLRWDIDDEWCRYCGSRGSYQFLSSPWGVRKLCYIHHKMWKQHRLNLSTFSEPHSFDTAINVAECTERDYLINILMECDDIDPCDYKRRSLRNKIGKNKNNNVDMDSSNYSQELSDMSTSSSESVSNESEHENVTNNNMNHNKNNKKRWRLDKEYQCRDCDKKFVSPKLFKTHCEDIHENTAPFYCDKCNKSYVNNGSLGYHIRKIHNKEINYYCNICSKGFFSKSECKKHEMTHEDKKIHSPVQYPCGDCTKIFVTKELLSYHILNIHTANADKPYQCSYCCYGSASKQEIIWHENIHENDLKNKFKCNYTAAKKHIVHKHELTHKNHQVKRVFKCMKCEKKFKTLDYLQQHMDRIHFVRKNKKFECHICQHKFDNKSYLKTHILSHSTVKPFKCEHCDYATQFKRRLLRHVDTHSGLKPFECDICGKKFRLKWYINSHKKNMHKNHGKKMLLFPPKPKDIFRPKKPLSSFFLFSKHIRNEIKLLFPEKSVIEIAKEIGKKWKLLDEKQQNVYKIQADKLYAEYRIKLNQYKKTHNYKKYKKQVKEWVSECDIRRKKNLKNRRKRMERKKKKRKKEKRKKKIKNHDIKIKKEEESCCMLNSDCRHSNDYCSHSSSDA